MKPVVRRFVLVLAVVAVIAGAFALLTPEPADAFFGLCAYYSDATFTQVVGARGTGCCGEPVNWGVVTPYKRCETIYCLDVICPIYE